MLASCKKTERFEQFRSNTSEKRIKGRVYIGYCIGPTLCGRNMISQAFSKDYLKVVQGLF